MNFSREKGLTAIAGILTLLTPLFSAFLIYIYFKLLDPDFFTIFKEVYPELVDMMKTEREFSFFMSIYGVIIIGYILLTIVSSILLFIFASKLNENNYQNMGTTLMIFGIIIGMSFSAAGFIALIAGIMAQNKGKRYIRDQQYTRN